MGWADVDDRIDLVAKRVDLLEALAAGPRYKPALVEATGDSRSTVDRAIRELEAAGLIERTDEGFWATLAGRLAAERYRAFVAEETRVLDSAEAYHRERTTVDGSPRSLAVAERYLGDVAAERGDLGAARAHYETAAEAFVELSAVDRAAATALALVEACAEADVRADARAWVDRLRELTDDAALGEYREAVAAWNDRLASD